MIINYLCVHIYARTHNEPCVCALAKPRVRIYTNGARGTAALTRAARDFTIAHRSRRQSARRTHLSGSHTPADRFAVFIACERF